MIRFAQPWVLLLFLPWLALVVAHARGLLGGRAAMMHSGLGMLPGRQWDWRGRILGIARAAGLALLIVALARPQSGHREISQSSLGVDVMLVLDTSTSMQALDMAPGNRLDAAKLAAERFVQARPYDRTGLVVFAGQSFTQCPLTLDHGVLLQLIRQVKFGMVEDGTAIGVALASAVSRLKGSSAKSRVIILLTDGRNNGGSIDPGTAARLSQALGIKVYTVGVGVEGRALYPVDDPVTGRRYERVESDVDDIVLKKIAEVTGGRYWRATNRKALDEIYNTLGRLEKSRIDERVTVEYEDLGGGLCRWALLLIGVETLLRFGPWLRVP